MYKFIELKLNSNHKKLYENLVKPTLDDNDYCTWDDLIEFYDNDTKKFESWFLQDTSKNEIIGWCSIRLIFPPDINEGEYHFYGGVIKKEYRGKGLSKLLYKHRMDKYKGNIIGVSIQPSNIISLNAAISMGFKPSRYREPWLCLRYKEE